MKVLLYWDDKRKYKIKGLKTVKQNALEVVRDIITKQNFNGSPAKKKWQESSRMIFGIFAQSKSLCAICTGHGATKSTSYFLLKVAGIRGFNFI